MRPTSWIAEKREPLTLAGCLLFSFGCAFLLLRFFEVTWNPLICVLTAGALMLAVRSALRCTERRVWIACAVFSAFLSAAVVVGRRVDEENAEFLGLSGPDLVYWLCFAACFAALGVAVCRWLCAHPLRPLCGRLSAAGRVLCGRGLPYGSEKMCPLRKMSGAVPGIGAEDRRL